MYALNELKSSVSVWPWRAANTSGTGAGGDAGGSCGGFDGVVELSVHASAWPDQLR